MKEVVKASKGHYPPPFLISDVVKNCCKEKEQFCYEPKNFFLRGVLMEGFFVTSCMATIEIWLRRTVIRPVILLAIVKIKGHENFSWPFHIRFD